MGRYILKIKDYYLEWSTVVDCPVTFGMNLDQLTRHIRHEYGANGLRDLPERLERVNQTGTSKRGGNLQDVISGNRAGPNESELDLGEIHQAYCLQEPIRGGWKAS